MTNATHPPASTDRASRTFTMTLDINASPEDVWRALTEAGELVRWFPLQARVTPERGGTMFWGWDEQWSWESTIETWEPGRCLTLVENRPAFDAQGNPLSMAPRRMAMEFTLESDAGRTRLRIVHSGFGEGAAWDDELESVSAGWQFELRGLRHYLEHHKGRDRIHAAAHQVTSLPQESVWKRLLSSEAFTVEPVDGSMTEGTRCVVRSSTGDSFTGTIGWHNPGHDLFVVVDDLTQGVLRLCTWRAAGKTGVQVWLVTYSAAHAGRVRDFGAAVGPLLTRLLQAG